MGRCYLHLRWYFLVQGAHIYVQIGLFIKEIENISAGLFLGHLPKMHYSALYFTVMYCSVNTPIIHSSWVKYDL